jgi:hypothetical protein
MGKANAMCCLEKSLRACVSVRCSLLSPSRLFNGKVNCLHWHIFFYGGLVFGSCHCLTFTLVSRLLLVLSNFFVFFHDLKVKVGLYGKTTPGVRAVLSK